MKQKITPKVPEILDRTEARSAKYQWFIIEQPVSHEVMSSWTEEVGLNKIINQNDPEIEEQLAELKDKLSARLWQVIDKVCTPIQKEVITLYYKEGLTQVEIAKRRGVNQSSCIKTLIGNATYYGERKNYGGAFPKLKRHLSADPEFQALLLQIRELQEE